MAKKAYALDPTEREKECTHDLGFPWSGKYMPCTGVRRCPLCHTLKERQDDPVALVVEVGAALSLAQSEHQKAIFNLATGTEIQVSSLANYREESRDV